MSRDATQKFNRVFEDLREFGRNHPSAHTVTVYVDDQGGTNPASTVDRYGNGDITIRLRRWFIEMSSVGEIVGLISHELGVHTLADLEMSQQERQNEQLAQQNQRHEQRDGRTYTLAAAGLPNDRRQLDHVNAVVRGSPRYREYVNTVLRMGDAIENDANRGNGDKIRDQRDLVRTFGFDVGRILATDDSKAVQVFLKTGDIAHIQNEEIDHLITTHQGGHAWLGRLGYSRDLGLLERLNPFSGASVRERLTGVGDLEASGTGAKKMLAGKVGSRGYQEFWRQGRSLNERLPQRMQGAGSTLLETANWATDMLTAPTRATSRAISSGMGFGWDMLRGNTRAALRGARGGLNLGMGMLRGGLNLGMGLLRGGVNRGMGMLRGIGGLLGGQQGYQQVPQHDHQD